MGSGMHIVESNDSSKRETILMFINDIYFAEFYVRNNSHMRY